MAPARADTHAVVDHREEPNMSENTTMHAGPVPAEAERRLVRPTEDRVLAGVCAGLSRYFGISPLVYRVAFAALLLLGGSGLVLYAVAWLVIPDERRGESIVGEALRDRRKRPWLAVGVVLVLIGLAAGVTDGLWPPRLDLVWLAVLGLGLSLVWSYVSEESEATTEHGPEPAPAPASAPTAETGGTPPVAAEPHGPEERRLRIPVVAPVLGAAIAVTGLLAILDATDVVAVDWTVALAVIVVLIGAGVAVGAFFGNVGWLAALGVLLASVVVAISAIDLPLDGPIGDRTVRPTSAAQLEETYEQSVGQLTLDLTALELPAGRTEVDARVGIGDLLVEVPAGVNVDVKADVTAGEAEVFGSSDDGWHAELDLVEQGSSAEAPTLVLETQVGFGHLEVRRG
jgi:phage shock protein PspC (stress-responsive transcriptional regulator)